MHSHLNVYPSGYMPYLNKYLISCLIPVSINPYELNLLQNYYMILYYIGIFQKLQ